MIPITRKEQYINEIVGNGDTAPEKPISREEIFFSSILGETVPPEPISKTEIYLSKISGTDIEIPEPMSRHEIFLAKAAGMDISTPVPITREEMLWSNYTGAVEFTLEGIPPLTYKAVEGTLKNYRIYGNTVDGESVGDLVTSGEHAGEYRVPVTVIGKNLFNEAVVVDKTIESGKTNAQIYHQDGKLYMNGSTTTSQSDFEIAFLTTVNAEALEYINKNFGSYYFSSACPGNIQTRYTIEGSSKQYYTTGKYTSAPSRTADRIVFRLQKDYQYNHERMDIQIERGGGSTSYEPYHEPIATNLYLPRPLRMTEDKADYIDFKEQKIHFADGTSADVTLPALPTISGTNILSVGTEVQPSMVYVKGEKQRD